LDELRLVHEPSDARIAAAVTELGLQGAAGLTTARAALQGDSVGLVLVAARVLLGHGSAADHALVADRLVRPVPQRSAPLLFGALLERDPVLVSPAYLAGLLDHPQDALRELSAKELARRASAADVPLLAALLRAERSDSRVAALDVLAGIPDDTVRNLVLDRLDDPVAKVAMRAAQILAQDPLALDQLAAAAFPEGALDRRGAYARLALVEREDRLAQSLVGEERTALLLADLGHLDPLRRGVAALLLAGIGFRAESSRGYEWLDRAVPHELVRQVSGDAFHKDFSSLVEPCQRRLALISGETLGGDGEAWRRWWIQSAATFRAHRAVIDVGPGEEASLVVRYKGPPPEQRTLRFLGSAASLDDPLAPVVGRTVLLDLPTSADLTQRLRSEGAFSAARLPTPSVAFGAAVRELEVRVGEQAKRFVLPAASRGDEDRWFEGIVATLERLEQENRWQRYPAGAEARAFFEAQSPWWSSTEDLALRDQRLKELVLADLQHLLAFERGPGLAELAALAQRGALTADDFPAILALARDERYYGERVAELTELAALAVRPADGGPLPEAKALELVQLLGEAFPVESAPAVVAVLGQSDPALARGLARDERAILRALAAAGLAESAAPEDLELLLGMLSDPMPDVEAAAILACAEYGRHEADVEIAYRARVAEPRVRQAALRAVGRLRLEGARDVLMSGLADADQGVQIAAAEGLADLADPEAAALFVSVLSRGERSPLYPAAHRGLVALGAAAHEPLLRAASTPGNAAGREAAFLLSEGLVPEAVPILIRLLANSPDDGRAAAELAILSAIDFRERDDPAAAWSDWYRTTIPGDALAWLRAAGERVGLRAPEAAEFAGEGSALARTFLLDLLSRRENHLVERARRELSRLVGADLGDLPVRGPLRDTWIADLAERVAIPGALER
jgi:HEAT repeat protein